MIVRKSESPKSPEDKNETAVVRKSESLQVKSETVAGGSATIDWTAIKLLRFLSDFPTFGLSDSPTFPSKTIY